jgi:hypothetical protein
MYDSSNLVFTYIHTMYVKARLDPGVCFRGMVACVGMMVARLSAFAGTNVVGRAITTQCSSALYGAAGLVLSTYC